MALTIKTRMGRRRQPVDKALLDAIAVAAEAVGPRITGIEITSGGQIPRAMGGVYDPRSVERSTRTGTATPNHDIAAVYNPILGRWEPTGIGGGAVDLKLEIDGKKKSVSEAPEIYREFGKYAAAAGAPSVGFYSNAKGGHIHLGNTKGRVGRLQRRWTPGLPKSLSASLKKAVAEGWQLAEDIRAGNPLPEGTPASIVAYGSSGAIPAYDSPFEFDVSEIPVPYGPSETPIGMMAEAPETLPESPTASAGLFGTTAAQASPAPAIAEGLLAGARPELPAAGMPAAPIGPMQGPMPLQASFDFPASPTPPAGFGARNPQMAFTSGRIEYGLPTGVRDITPPSASYPMQAIPGPYEFLNVGGRRPAPEPVQFSRSTSPQQAAFNAVRPELPAAGMPAAQRDMQGAFLKETTEARAQQQQQQQQSAIARNPFDVGRAPLPAQTAQAKASDPTDYFESISNLPEDYFPDRPSAPPNAYNRALKGAGLGAMVGGVPGAIVGGLIGAAMRPGSPGGLGGLGGLFGTRAGPSFGERQRASFDAGSAAIRDRFGSKTFTPQDVTKGGPGSAGYAGKGLSAVSSVVEGIAPPGTTASYTDGRGNTIGTVTAIPEGFAKYSSRFDHHEVMTPFGMAGPYPGKPSFSYGPRGFNYSRSRGQGLGGLFGAVGRNLGGLFGTVTTPARQAIPVTATQFAYGPTAVTQGYSAGASPGAAGYGGTGGYGMAGAFGLGGGGAHAGSTDSRGL